VNYEDLAKAILVPAETPEVDPPQVRHGWTDPTIGEATRGTIIIRAKHLREIRDVIDLHVPDNALPQAGEGTVVIGASGTPEWGKLTVQALSATAPITDADRGKVLVVSDTDRTKVTPFKTQLFRGNIEDAIPSKDWYDIPRITAYYWVGDEAVKQNGGWAHNPNLTFGGIVQAVCREDGPGMTVKVLGRDNVVSSISMWANVWTPWKLSDNADFATEATRLVVVKGGPVKVQATDTGVTVTGTLKASVGMETPYLKSTAQADFNAITVTGATALQGSVTSIQKIAGNITNADDALHAADAKQWQKGIVIYATGALTGETKAFVGTEGRVELALYRISLIWDGGEEHLWDGLKNWG